MTPVPQFPPAPAQRLRAVPLGQPDPQNAVALQEAGARAAETAQQGVALLQQVGLMEASRHGRARLKLHG